jgi:hypothetical protein
VRKCGLDASGSWKELVVDFRDYGNKLQDSIHDRDILEYICDFLAFHKGFCSMDLASYPATNACNVLIKMIFKREGWNAISSFVRQCDSLGNRFSKTIHIYLLR